MEIEPRPISTWGITLASRLPRPEWNKVRQRAYFEADYKCEICGESKLQLHCHEQWGFDDRKRIQYLVALRCVCEVCHDVIHFGRSSYAYRKSYVKQLVKHWCKVNNKTEKDFNLYRQQIRAISKKRANKSYIVIAGDYTLT